VASSPTRLKAGLQRVQNTAVLLQLLTIHSGYFCMSLYAERPMVASEVVLAIIGLATVSTPVLVGENRLLR
jgi:hypothetical protein